MPEFSRMLAGMSKEKSLPSASALQNPLRDSIEETSSSSQEEVAMSALPVSPGFYLNTTVVDDIAFHAVSALGYLS